MADQTRLAIPSVLLAFERRYRGDHKREHALLLDRDGTIVAQRTGDFDSVNFDDRDLKKAVGGFLTHTHPRCLPPSGADLALASQYNLLLRAVGDAPDTHQRFDHTVRIYQMLDGKTLQRSYESEIERAEQELARLPLGDLQWQREARHLALKRFSVAYGFTYERKQPGTVLSEATRREQMRLDHLASVKPTLAREVWLPLAANLHRVLLKASRGGVVPITQLGLVRAHLDALVQRAMLGQPTRSGTLIPYSVKRGQVVSRSAYFTALYSLVRQAAGHAIDEQAAIMRKYLPDDLIRAFENATLEPSELAETDEPQYDPLHLWLGPDGKRLSDRIWQAAGDVRSKLDNYLSQAIARQVPVEQMAAELETFLVDGAGGYAALRLARTETSAAHSRAGYLAAQRNPFVEKYQPFTSPQHSCSDECDIEEANGPYGMDDPSHLPPFHPNCADGVRYILVQNIKATVARLREQVANAIANARRAITDLLNPLSRNFLDWLFRGRP